MPARSNTETVNQYLIITEAPTGQYRVTSTTATTAYKRSFSPNPDPANNTGKVAGRFVVSPYSYTKSEERGMIGQKVYNFWGRESGDPTNAIKLWERRERGCYGLPSTWGHYMPRQPLLQANTDALAWNRCLSKVYDQVRSSEISLNTSIGEGRETFEMLHGIAKAFKTHRYATLVEETKALLKALKKSKGNVASSGWLGWSVGWKPFLNDINNIFEHFANLQKQPYLDFVGVARARSSGFFSTWAHPEVGRSDVMSYDVRYQVGFKYRITDLTTFNEWQLGLTVRPTLAWELTRLSFVVDYFVNIGQYLALLEASLLNNGVQLVDGYVSRTARTSDVSYKRQTFPPPAQPANVPSPYTLVEETWDCWRNSVEFGRSALTSLPKPVLPAFKIPKASGPLLNCMALLHQFTRK